MADTKIPSEEPESNVNNEQDDDVTIPTDASQTTATDTPPPTLATLASLLRFPLKWPRSSEARAITTTMAGAAFLAAVRAFTKSRDKKRTDLNVAQEAPVPETAPAKTSKAKRNPAKVNQSQTENKVKQS